jgi:deferrochelatase/peroxidase EfeB
MTQAMVTFVAPLALDKLAAAENAIDVLGNPASDAVRKALELQPNDENGTHFASLHAIRSQDGERAYIVFEFSADGTDDVATSNILAALAPMLKPVFMLSSDWSDGGDLGSFLKAYKVVIDNGLFGNPGQPFSGAPGFTVGRIHFEAQLARKCASQVENQHKDTPALTRIAQVRRAVEADTDLKCALQPATPAPPFDDGNLGGVIITGIGQFISMYLWPLLAVVLLAGLIGGLAAAWYTDGLWPWVGAFALGAIRTIWAALWIALVAVVVAAIVIYLALRKAEATDSIEVHSPPQALNRAMFEHENKLAQNHMISITQRKPGWLRWFTARLVFWVVGLAATSYFKPGFLSDIGTIHFARWVTVPKSRDVLFMSNYDGSWESYLEDFITKAHAGLTGIWSNTIGFPKTENLFQLGATDGDRFKRFARHSMVPTRFWYSAYPDITTDSIRLNAAIRAGLSGVMTEDEAINWLALFGSAARPASKLVSNDIQSLVFGGLGFLPFGTALICELPTDRETARRWLKAVYDDIAFNDGRRLAGEAVITLSLSWRGLTRLGLPEYVGPTFPLAFVDGMTRDYRSRILGDVDENSPPNWRWGSNSPDAAVLIYGRSDTSVADVKMRFLDACKAAGMPVPHEVPLQTVTEDKTEPFGFTDGVSQPVIRGTYKSLRNADPIHIVEPGEMILGYPDNRGYIPPSPTLLPNADPGNKLPLLGAPNDFSRSVADAIRDVGFNGSFLVIRELEQDVNGFAAYCKAEASRLNGRLSPPYYINEDYIGAKLVGRWKDGSSLVRQPYESATEHREKLLIRAATQAQLSVKLGENLVMESTDVNSSSRPKSNPLGGTPIDPAAHPTISTIAATLPGLATGPVVGAAAEPAAESAAVHKKPVRPDNDFLFGAEDPEGLRCPYGAHIRRANPRDSLDPGNADQVSISNRHRIMRIGRHYVPTQGENPGLFFMCLCADIERQFEFLQQTWLKSPSFHGLTCQKDPLLGDAQEGACGFTVPSPDGPIALNAMPRFVTTKGGGYFFLPGRRLIEYLIDPL